MVGAEAPRAEYRHERGSNCTTTAMMNLLRYHGLSISEELCLGVGSGLGFTYLRGIRLPLFLVFGRSDDLELNLARAVGMHMVLQSHPDPAEAWRGVVAELESTGPVLLDTDVSKMPYTAEALAWPSFGSHGGHKVVVTGYSERDEQVEICDYLWSRPRRVALRDLWAAWVSDDGPAMGARNYWYRVVVPGHFEELGHAVREGIRMNLHRMTQPWDKFFGLPALKAFLSGVTGWRFALPPPRLMAQARASYVSLEVGGTGRGAFRRMYGRFLREAAEIVGEPDLLTLADDYLGLARRWSELAALLRDASVDPGRGLFDGDPAREALTRELWDGERRCLDLLGAVAGRWA
jgi:hypothetical protein